MRKSDLKTEYKLLVRAGDYNKAQKKLEEIWKLSGIDKSIKSTPKPLKSPKKKAKKEFGIKNLSEIKGIGSETIKDLERIYSNIEELKSALAEDKVPLRNDLCKKLKKKLEVK